MAQVRWTERASRDLQSIYSYVAEDSEAAAERPFVSLVSATDQLLAFPRSGRIIPRYEQSGVREIIVRPCRNAYRVVDDEIRVEEVHHGARLLHWDDIEARGD